MSTLFDTTVPGVYVGTDGPVSLGTLFTVDTDGDIVGGRYYKNDSQNDGEMITMSLYGADASSLATVTRTQSAGDAVGWIEISFSTPVAVVPGVTYTTAWHASGVTYSKTDEVAITTFSNPPLFAPDNYAVYAYGGVVKPTTASGGSSYLIDVQFIASPAVRSAVKALDTANAPPDQAWFTSAYEAGFRLYIPHGTLWGQDAPDPALEQRFGWAIAAGLKIAVYTRDPRWFESGITAAGQYRHKLQFFALDVESDPGIAVTRAMVNGVAAMGVRPIIYTGSGMWASIQGATANDFSDVPLWDTDTSNIDYATWTADVDSPPPVQYGGWNTPSTLRVGIQQKFEQMLNGVAIDLNSWDASFLLDLPDYTGSAATVWDGSTELPAYLTVWSGTNEIAPLGVEQV